MLATSPLTHAESTVVSDQLLAVVVFQLPLPSVGAAGLAPLASQVSVCANAGLVHSAAAVGISATAKSLARFCVALRMFHSPIASHAIARLPRIARS
jgi:hypothetical protein